MLNYSFVKYTLYIIDAINAKRAANIQEVHPPSELSSEPSPDPQDLGP